LNAFGQLVQTGHVSQHATGPLKEKVLLIDQHIYITDCAIEQQALVDADFEPVIREPNLYLPHLG
jgi:hypothetical protein